MASVFKNLATPSGVRRLWKLVEHLPGRGQLMGALLGRLAPYTGTIKPELLELSPGYAKLRMKDRPGLRNHLRSVHAIALMNLGEATTGAAMMFSLPDGTRGIPNKLSMEYLHKARGDITAECRCEVPPVISERIERLVTAELFDGSGTLVARMTAQWVIGPV